MKLWAKLCLAISVVITLLFGVGGHLIIQKSFDFSFEQIIRQYQYQHVHYRIFFENMIFRDTEYPDEISEQKVLETAQFLGGLSSFGIYYENLSALYSSSTMPTDTEFLNDLIQEMDGYIIKDYGDKTLLGVVSVENINGEDLYLITVNNIHEVFVQRDEQYRQMVFLNILLLLITLIFVLFFSIRITRPLKKLTVASEKIANGALRERTNIRSKDEIGLLSGSFDKMAEAVEEKVDSLEQTVRAREDFISNFSHELKTPMTAIMGYADMLRSYQSEPEVQIKAANYIYKESKQLGELSLKLMDLMSLSEEHIELAAISTTALKVASIPDINWKLQPATVIADKLLLQRVLINLCTNARNAGAKSIIVSGTVQTGAYQIAVTDDGCGIPSEEIARITEPFYRIDKVRSRKNNGFGLGLSLCDKILKIHHTVLTITSTSNIGTSCTFSLPLDE